MCALALRARLKRQTCLSRNFLWRSPSRLLHKVPHFPFLEEGLGNFLPPPALRTLAHEWHGGLLERLNDQVAGTEYASKNVAQTVIDTAPRRQATLAFNYASLALNNHFFLYHLKPPPSGDQGKPFTHEDEMSPELRGALIRDFGEMAAFKSMFGGYALGLTTSGYIWVVSDVEGHLAILPTFGSGTLLVRGRSHLLDPRFGWGSDPWVPERQVNLLQDSESLKHNATSHHGGQASPRGTSPKTSPASGVSLLDAVSPSPPHSRSQSSFSNSFGEQPHSSAKGHNPQTSHSHGTQLHIGDRLFPLFCVSLFEHAWMSAGYGVWGKEQWLKELWTVLDWEKVSNNYAIAQKQP